MFYLFDSEFGFLLLIILFVVAFVKISNLKKRISILEGKLFSQKENPNSEFVPANVSALNYPGPSAETPMTAPSYTQEVQDEPTAGDKFITWLKDDWMLKLGGLLLLIGLGWFITFAIMKDMIGELARITLGILAGVAMLGLGSWRIRKYINQGGIFLVIGSAIILLTVFAARELYDMFTPFFALTLMFLSTAYIALISVKYNTFAVSLSGLVLAFIAPLLTNSGSTNEIGLFTYLLVITLGVIWIVAIQKNWGALIFSSLAGVFLYSLPFVTNYHNQPVFDTLIWFAYGFAMLFFLTSIINIISSKETDIKAFLWTAIGNGIFLLAWIMSVVTDEWQSSIIALWMIIFAIGSFIAFNVTKIKSVFFVYAGVALAMLLTATTIELDGSALIIALTVESFLIPVLVYVTTNDVRASSIGSLLIGVPAFMSLGNLEHYYRSSVVLSKDFFVIFLVVVALMTLGYMYRKIKTTIVDKDFFIDNSFLISGSVYAYILLWSMLHVGIYPEAAAITFSLAVFTVAGLVKYFYGISIGSKTLRNYGGILIGLVIIRLLFIDVWSMEIGARVFVFILIGVLLMSTAFISRRIKSGFELK